MVDNDNKHVCNYPDDKCAMHDRLEVQREQDRKLIAYIPQILRFQSRMVGGLIAVSVVGALSGLGFLLYVEEIKTNSNINDARIEHRQETVDKRINTTITKRIEQLSGLTIRNEERFRSVMAQLERLNDNLEKEDNNG